MNPKETKTEDKVHGSREPKKPEKKKKSTPWQTMGKLTKIFFLSLFWVSLSTLLVATVFLILAYNGYVREFKGAQKRSNSTQLVFYDKNNEVIYESFGTKDPELIKIDKVPKVVLNTTLAAEDARFYEHGAIDFKGIGRAAILNLKNSQRTGLSKARDLFDEKSYSQGGSTITQQLVKNIYLTNERSFERKIKEMIYAIEIEKTKSKDEILEEYLNNVYYGEQSLGIANAAMNYFNKDAQDLTLAEASLLAGLPQAPTRFSPISGSFKEAKKRQEYVLSKMIEHNMITFDEAKSAANEPLLFSPKKSDNAYKYPFAVDYIKKELELKIGPKQMSEGGFKIYTTIEPETQGKAERTIDDYKKKYASRKVSNAATVILNNEKKTIAAMVGGNDWEESKVNVTTSLRQPGSSFKPIVYLAGLLNGYNAGSLFIDKYINFGGNPPYAPRNYDGSFRGNITLRGALQGSLNIPAVQMAKLVGVEKVAQTAKLLGINTLSDTPEQYGLSIALGSAEVKLFEITRAYSVLANGGNYSEFSIIDKIVDNEGAEIYSSKPTGKSVVDEKIAYILTNILSDNKARTYVFGSRSPLYLADRPVAAKTGTTDEYADSWTIGYTPQYTTGVWMGNNDRTKMARVSGVEGAAFIWQDIMKAIHDGLPAKEFIRPEGIVEQWINPRTGLPATTKRAPNQAELFIPGTEPSSTEKFDYLKIFRRK